IRLILLNLFGLFLLRLLLFYRFSWFYMLLIVVVLISLIIAIYHLCDILIIRVEFDMLLLAIRSVSFWGVLGLGLFHKRNRFFCFLVLFGNKCKSLYIKSLIIFTPFLKSCK